MIKGRDKLIVVLQEELKAKHGNILTKKEAEIILGIVIDSIERTLLENLTEEGFSIKLNKFAKLTVKHRPSIFRKIPFNNGETTLTKAKRKVKLTVLGKLRAAEIA